MKLTTETIDQLAYGAVNGCEPAALLAGLHYQGSALDLDYPAFLKTMPIASDYNPYHGFGGDPYKNQAGHFEGIFDQPLTTWAKKYTRIKNLTPTSLTAIQQQLQAGNPVLAWVTVDFAAPNYDQYPFGKAITNNHAVLVSGFNSTEFWVMDPLKGQHYWLDKKQFAAAFNLRHMAVAILSPQSA